ncbi:hypothetical protein KBC04_00045 [Candidatus Babeliales bacterium]|nr:hypothetical protein [Candidatus Babeliales bacterium]MBP9843516.1 hypothetical protein [Candidatus Babeliales bacterium]
MKKITLLLLFSLYNLTGQCLASSSKRSLNTDSIADQIEEMQRELDNYIRSRDYTSILRVVEKFEELDQKNPREISSTKTLFFGVIKRNATSLLLKQNSEKK